MSANFAKKAGAIPMFWVIILEALMAAGIFIGGAVANQEVLRDIDKAQHTFIGPTQ